MIILTLRTDKPDAEIGLYNDHEQLIYDTWAAHRQLAETVHSRITKLLEGTGQAWKDIQGIVVYQGPGSFTGLRIGLSVANAIGYGLEIPLVPSAGETWIEQAIERLLAGNNQKVAVPDYGAQANVTAPRK